MGRHKSKTESNKEVECRVTYIDVFVVACLFSSSQLMVQVTTDVYPFLNSAHNQTKWSLTKNQWIPIYFSLWSAQSGHAKIQLDDAILNDSKQIFCFTNKAPIIAHAHNLFKLLVLPNHRGNFQQWLKTQILKSSLCPLVATHVL